MSSAGTPTARQVEVLTAVTRLTEAEGHAPTVRELADHLGISSNNGVMDHLRSLQAKGLLDWRPGRARTLRLTGLGAQFVPVRVGGGQ